MRNIFIMALLGAAAGAACWLPACSQDRRGESGRPVVFVSVPPQAYLAERIAGGHVEVEVLVGAGQNPHTYEPTPRQMTRLSRARALFRVGVPFEEALLPKLAPARGLRIVDTRKGIALVPTAEHGEDEAAHEAHAAPARHHHHHEGEPDPHIWLSPRLAKVQAQTIRETLAAIDPANKADYDRNLGDLQADLDALDAEVRSALAPLAGRTFFVFHPAFGYFARDYGLRQEAVETGGKAPGPRHVKELIERARAAGVRVVFVQPQFSRQAAEAIARQIDGVVVPIDPLAGDYIANLREVARKIREALGVPTAAPGSSSNPSPSTGEGQG